MAKVRGQKKILFINPSVFAPIDNFISPKSTKSPNKFDDPNGVVGLGIVAAMSNNQNSNKPAILVISPRSTSNPIPILTNNSNTKKNKQPTIEEMEMCEEYTRVISHVGTNLVKKMEYFDDQFLGNGYHKSTAAVAVSAPPEAFRTANFLNTCSFCHKQLQGLDIFIYRNIYIYWRENMQYPCFVKLEEYSTGLLISPFFLCDAHEEERKHFVAQTAVSSKSQLMNTKRSVVLEP